MTEGQPPVRGAGGSDANGPPAQAAGVVSTPDDASAAEETGRVGPEPTVGTGSLFAVGCVVLLLVGMAVLAAIFFLPFVGR